MRIRGSLTVLLIVTCTIATEPIGTVSADIARTRPGSPRGAAAVLAAGFGHTCALLDNGSVKCWGANNAGQLGLGDINFRGDSAGEMGDNLDSVDLGTGRTATTIAAGGSHTCALLDDGTVKCWGNNDAGALGLGDINFRGDTAGEMADNLATIDFGTGRTAQAISAGGFHTCALLDNGTVKCWGNNDLGALGYGDTRHRGDNAGEMGDQLAPVDLGTGRTATAITTGRSYTCALLDDGTVKCWGDNYVGQLGLGDTQHRGDDPGEMGDDLAPVELGTGRTATAISASYTHTCALLDDGTAKCWGKDGWGQLGSHLPNNHGDHPGQMGDNLPPIELGTGRTASAISAGELHTCALLDDGTIKCWGDNRIGQLGRGDVLNHAYPNAELGDNMPAVDLGAGRTATTVTAGFNHTCALLDNGTVKCWGANFVGQLGQGNTSNRGDEPAEMGDNLPPIDFGTAPLGALAAGGSHTCALLDNSSVKCWGDNASGQLGQGDTDHRGDSAGEMSDNLNPIELGTGRTATTITAGFSHTCALLDNRTIKCWGNNAFGQLGQGNTSNRGDNPTEMGDNLLAIELGTARTATAITAGGSHTCALLDNSTIKCWGDNNTGQLGQGNTSNRGDDPTEMGDNLLAIELGTARTATAITAGLNHTCALLDNSTIKCWGDNAFGQLGQGNTSNRGDNPTEMGDNLLAIELGTGRTATAITAGLNHTCALLDNNTIKCWGGNNTGQLGQGNTSNRGDNPTEMGDNLLAIELGIGRTATAITAGGSHTCALLDNNTIKCWGDNNTGQLGQGNTSNRGDDPTEMGDNLNPIELGTGRSVAAITAGDGHTCALLANRTIKCWGGNNAGQLGHGDTEHLGDIGEMGDNLNPIVLGTGRTVTAITAGDWHSCALLDNSTAKCWGNNVFGQLGYGDTDYRGDSAGEMGDTLTPIDLGTGRTATAITAGKAYACALLDNSTVKCWGDNLWGQLGLGDTDHRGDSPGEMGDNLTSPDLGTGRTAQAITAGSELTCALLDNDTIKCWGQNGFGQLGQGDRNHRGDGPGELGDQLPPIDLGTGRTAQAISAGERHACALLDNGTVKCWGSNDSGQLGQGDTVDRGDGPGDMGDNLTPIDLGTGRTAQAISAGTALTCALLDNSTVKCWGDNDWGQLGQGDSGSRGDSPGEMGDQLSAIELGPGRSARAIAAGEFHVCALLDNNTVKCWGDNAAGQLGQGSTSNRGDLTDEMGDHLPTTDLGTGRTAQAIDGGLHHTCALLDNSTLKCWGNNATGQLGQGDTDALGADPGEMGDNLSPVQPSRSLSVTPRSAEPAAPTATVALPGDGQADLTWTAPIDNGGTPVTGYRIESSTDGITWTTNIADTGSSATTATIAGLTNWASIRFRVAAINARGTGPSSGPSTSVIPIGPPVFFGIDPVRVLDTRDGLGFRVEALDGTAPVPSGTSIAIPVTGVVPSDAMAVVVNLTTTRSGESGFLTIHPCGEAVPEASNLNFQPGVDTADLAIAPVGTGGTICVYASATTDLIADITGYTVTGYEPATPTRLIDTRRAAPLPAGNTLRVSLPQGAAQAVTVTATRATADGYVTTYDCSQPQPDTSSVNYAPDVDTANLIVATGSELCVFTSAAVDIIVDHHGTISGASTTTQRLVDTRTGGIPLAPGDTVAIPAISVGGTTRAMNITSSQQGSAGFLTLQECGAPAASTSNLNFTPGRDIANLAIIPTALAMCVTTSATTHLIIDLIAAIS